MIDTLLDAVLEHVTLLSRHRASYAIGSLAHGGFAPSVSDVDVAVLLEGPADRDDGARFAAIKDELIARQLPLAERLSIFWQCIPFVADAGRLPAVDRLDLLESGRLLAGRDVRASLPAPTVEELVCDTARFIVGVFAERVIAVMRERLVSTERRFVTKVILFPVRFLYTLRTGRAGRVEDAAVDYTARVGAAHTLATTAVACRDGVTSFAELIDREAIRALYDELEAELRPWLIAAGHHELAGQLALALHEVRAQLH